MTQQHTPTPWRWGKGFHSLGTTETGPTCLESESGRVILKPAHYSWNGRDNWQHFIEVSRANKKFIVRACNAHDDLLEACKEILGEFDGNYGGMFRDAVSAMRIKEISQQAIAEATE